MKTKFTSVYFVLLTLIVIKGCTTPQFSESRYVPPETASNSTAKLKNKSGLGIDSEKKYIEFEPCSGAKCYTIMDLNPGDLLMVDSLKLGRYKKQNQPNGPVSITRFNLPIRFVDKDKGNLTNLERNILYAGIMTHQSKPGSGSNYNDDDKIQALRDYVASHENLLWNTFIEHAALIQFFPTNNPRHNQWQLVFNRRDMCRVITDQQINEYFIQYLHHSSTSLPANPTCDDLDDTFTPFIDVRPTLEGREYLIVPVDVQIGSGFYHKDARRTRTNFVSYTLLSRFINVKRGYIDTELWSLGDWQASEICGKDNSIHSIRINGDARMTKLVADASKTNRRFNKLVLDQNGIQSVPSLTKKNPGSLHDDFYPSLEVDDLYFIYLNDVEEVVWKDSLGQITDVPQCQLN